MPNRIAVKLKEVIRYDYDDAQNKHVLNANEFISVLNKLQKRTDYLERKTNKLTTIKNNNDSTELRSADIDLYDEFGEIEMYSLSRRYLSNEPSIIDKEEIQKVIDKNNVELNENNTLIEELVKIANRSIQKNKGDFQLEIVLFNSGNTQGVVRYKGQLILNKVILNLSKKLALKKNIDKDMKYLGDAFKGEREEEFLQNFVIIEPKSFSGLTLIIEQFNNRQRDIETIQREYISGYRQVLLLLFDIENNKLKESAFQLINDIEMDESESLMKYLENNYTRYLPD